MKVSVLVPVYKAEKYIEKCSRSIFAQTYSNLECVFVNDCTPDNSIQVLLKVIEDYPNRKEQIRIINNTKNLGAAASKNLAIKYATGDFICFVDSDDWLDVDAIELLIKRHVETHADVIWGLMTIHTKDGIMELKEPSYRDKNHLINSYITERAGGTLLSNSRRIIRKELIELNGIRMMEGLNFSEDRLFMNQVAYNANGFSIIDRPVYHYNKLNDDSQTEKIVNKKGFAKRYIQMIGNYQLIEVFFMDKEGCYYSEAAITKLLFLKEVMDTALRYSSRELFNVAVKHINNTKQEFWSAINWDRSLKWRRRHSNYYYRKILPIMRSIINRFKVFI